MTQQRPIKIGDVVRIRGTPATLAAELAGLVGQVRQIADPRGGNLDVIGLLVEGDAYQVYFEQRRNSFWLAAPLLVLEQQTERFPIAEERDPADGKSDSPSAALGGPPPPKTPRLRRLIGRIQSLVKGSLKAF